ncbi:MAG: lycopene cyclase domain-containing protein [Actinomycetales bacterium]|nr:lycopene cyclase domain-containing protein [Actinomycetales bacterium]
MNLTYLWVVLWVALPLLVVLARPLSRLSKATIAFLAIGTLGLSLVFDNIIVGLGIVAYDGQKILGLRLPVAPIEDFAYTLVAVAVVPVLWAALGKKRGTDD